MKNVFSGQIGQVVISMFADTLTQLRKLSIRKMQFQVTQIEFDFSDDCSGYLFNDEQREELIDETLSTIWEAVDEDDLIEEITSASGWCIKSIDYRHVLR